MPGPMLTVAINESLKSGKWAGPKLVAGHSILELFLVCLVYFGLGFIFTMPLVKGGIGLVGGAVLIWMSFGMMNEARRKSEIQLGSSDAKGNLNLVLSGAIVSISNPYWSIWWATAGASALILASAIGPTGVISFFFGHIASDFVWYSLVSYAVAKGRTLFTPKVFQTVLTACGIFLSVLSIYFIYSGINFLRTLL